jgi:histidine ammonia-lyase
VVTLTGHSLTLKEIRNVLYEDQKVHLSSASLERVDASRRAVEAIVEKGKIVYGITTGFGKFSDVLVKSEDT